MASLRHGRLKTGKPPEDTETGEVSVPVKGCREEILVRGEDLNGEGRVPGRVWDRVALAAVWEEETGVPLAGPGAVGVNGWRVSGGVVAAAAAVLVAVPVVGAVAVAGVAEVAEAVEVVAAGSKDMSDGRTIDSSVLSNN